LLLECVCEHYGCQDDKYDFECGATCGDRTTEILKGSTAKLILQVVTAST